MKAIAVQNNELVDVTAEYPTAKEHDLIVKVEAISVNPVDYKVRNGHDSDEQRILGWDAAATVVELGSSVEGFSVGDKVWYAGDLTRAGTNAEYQAVDYRIVSNRPKSISTSEAAALPLTAITAYELLFDRLQVQNADSGSSILIVGAAGGVGSIMIQLVKQLTDLKVIATASRENTAAWVRELGADVVIDHRNPLAAELATANEPQVQYVAALNGSEHHYEQIIESLAPQGHLAMIDDPTEPMDIRPLKLKSLSFHWELMFTRSMFETSDIIKQQKLLQHVADLIDEGAIKTTVSEHFGTINAANLNKAHKLLQSGKSVGKIVLEGF